MGTKIDAANIMFFAVRIFWQNQNAMRKNLSGGIQGTKRSYIRLSRLRNKTHPTKISAPTTTTSSS
jgi:hypothetical protein